LAQVIILVGLFSIYLANPRHTMAPKSRRSSSPAAIALAPSPQKPARKAAESNTKGKAKDRVRDASPAPAEMVKQDSQVQVVSEQSPISDVEPTTTPPQPTTALVPPTSVLIEYPRPSGSSAASEQKTDVVKRPAPWCHFGLCATYIAAILFVVCVAISSMCRSSLPFNDFANAYFMWLMRVSEEAYASVGHSLTENAYFMSLMYVSEEACTSVRDALKEIYKRRSGGGNATWLTTTTY